MPSCTDGSTKFLKSWEKCCAVMPFCLQKLFRTSAIMSVKMILFKWIPKKRQYCNHYFHITCNFFFIEMNGKHLVSACELGPVTALPDSGPTQLHRKNRHHTNLGSNSPQTQWGKTCKSLVKLQWSREAKLECKAAKVGTAVQASLLFGHAMDRIHCGGWWCSMSRHVFLKVYVYTFIYMYLYIYICI